MQRLLKNREILLGLIIVVMIAGFSTRASNFATPGNLATIFNDTSILIILALGQMTVILTKSIDLSVAANLAFTGMAVAMLDAAELCASDESATCCDASDKLSAD